MPVSQINSNSLATGVPARSNMPAGSVLQVQYFQLTSVASTTSTSMNDTGLTVTITPTSATSKFLVVTNMSYGCNTSNIGAAFNFVRNGSAVGNSSASTTINFGTAGVAINLNHATTISMAYLDSPATASALTYKVQWQAQTGGYTSYLNRSNQLNNGTDTFQGGYTSSITVYEVAA